MFWAVISLESLTELFLVERGTVNAHTYITDILELRAITYAGFVDDGFALIKQSI